MRHILVALFMLVSSSASASDPAWWPYGVEPPPTSYAHAKLSREPIEIQLSKAAVNRFCGGNVLNHFRACTLYGEAAVGYASLDPLLDIFDRLRLAAERLIAMAAGETPCAEILPWVGTDGAVEGEQNALRSHERGHCSGLVHGGFGRRWFRPDGVEVF